MVGFTKLHQCIIHSSIWSQELHVRIVWVSMLAMANAEGVVEASISGLARACNVTLEQCRDALSVLMSPDPETRDGTTGERVAQVDGGFWILNYGNYRDRQTEQQRKTAERVRRHRERKKVVESPADGDGVTPPVTPVTPVTTEAEAEAEADKSTRTPPARRARAFARPDSVSEEAWDDWRTVRRNKRAGPVTATAWKRFQSEVKKAGAGWTEQAAVELCAARGWVGFDAEWVADKKPAGKPIVNMNPSAISGGALEAARRKEAQMAQQAQDARVAGLCKGLGDSKRVAQ